MANRALNCVFVSGGMGETVHCGSFLSSMRDLSEDISNTCSYSMYCGGDKTLPYGQYQNGFSARPPTDSYERDFLKQTMLEHATIFLSLTTRKTVSQSLSFPHSAYSSTKARESDS